MTIKLTEKESLEILRKHFSLKPTAQVEPLYTGDNFGPIPIVGEIDTTPKRKR